jgi:hypothetical protein
MPFQTFVRQGVLTSDDLDLLQRVYESAAAHFYSIDDMTMHKVVRTLIRHVQAGERDRYWLVQLAESELRRAAG